MIENQTFWNQFFPNGSTTIFPTVVVAKDAADIQVWYRSSSSAEAVLKTYPADYTIANLGGVDGVNITTTFTPANGSELDVIRIGVKDQLVHLTKNVLPNSVTLELGLDKLALHTQELDARIQQCFKYPDYEGNDGQANVPDKTLRTNTLAGFDENGDFYLYDIDPLLLTLTPPSTINTSDIADAAVTAVKLAATLDLSSKTLTFPAASVTAVNLAATLDLSSKTLTLPTASVTAKNVATGSFVSDHTLGWLTLSKIRAGSTYTSFTLSGAGTTAANTTYVYSTTVNGKPKYVASNSYYVQWTGSVWTIYTNAAAALYSSKTGNGWTTADQVGSQWEIGGGTGVAPAPSTTLSGYEFETSGVVSAGSFRGDISQCTGGQVPIPVVRMVENRDRANLGNLCFIGQDNRVYVAGKNNVAQIAPAVVSVKSLSRVAFDDGNVAVPGVTADLNGGTDTVVSVVQTAVTTLALTAAGFVYAMGTNAYGQLGQNNTTTYSYFRALFFNTAGVNSPISKIYCFDTGGGGSFVRCYAIDTSGGVWAWGYNGNGELGLGDTATHYVPTKITALSSKTVTKVASSALDCFFLCSDGAVYSCGLNSTGALGQGDLLGKTTALLITSTGSTKIITDIAAAGRWDGTTNISNVALLANDGKIYTAGYGAYGGIGDTFTTTRSSITDISANVGTATAIFALGNFGGAFLAVRSDNTVRVWGYNAGTGALGTGAASNVSTPANPTALSTALSGTTIVDAISSCTYNSSATDTTFVLLANGQVWGCGDNSAYQLVDGTTTDSLVFKRLGVSSGITAIRSSGANSWTYLDSLGKLWAVGGNAEYQAGQGHADAYGFPVQVKL